MPILGVCLGHQAIAESYGGKLSNLEQVYHGVSTSIEMDASNLFDGIASGEKVGRYHSWVVESDTLPDSLKVIARDSEGMIMAIEHNNGLHFGIQFHPESVLTECGEQIIKNFLKQCNEEAIR